MNKNKNIVLLIMALSVLFVTHTISAEPENEMPVPQGMRYKLRDDGNYDFSKALEKELIINGEGFAGSFSLEGNIVEDGERNGFKAYYVENGDVSFTLTLNDQFLPDQRKDGWEISLDQAQRINNDRIIYGLDLTFHEGAVIVQVSSDSKHWIPYTYHCGVFSALRTHGTINQTFTTNSIQLNNGCYYRITFAYELKKEKAEKSFFGSKYDYINYAEVYQFYLYNEEAKNYMDIASMQQYRLGNTIKTEDNFYGMEIIDPKDKHYGWDLGYFFISGFTEHRELNENHIFLKNVGDEITLWFNLQQDINAPTGNSKLAIKNDNDITDQYFGLPKTNFGRGALIVRYTDYQNISHDPIVYTNFLEAAAFPFANTKIELFEEGDYEVALDYSIDKNHYKIPFTFSIRNSNCMVYPFDVITKSELVNNSYTEDGFYLDLARSRYLEINVKRVVMVNGVEDIRFNKSARDGEQYIDDGIYIITVRNKVTGEQTEKRIYVGADYKQYSQN